MVDFYDPRVFFVKHISGTSFMFLADSKNTIGGFFRFQALRSFNLENKKLEVKACVYYGPVSHRGIDL